jgi:beta-glucanase (GH16 family)
MRKINSLILFFLLSLCLMLSYCSNKNFVAKNESQLVENKIKIENEIKSENESPKKYKLVWADEFNSKGAPDSTKWSYDIGTGDWGWGNNEKEYYTNRSQNVGIEKGKLKITALKENFKGSAYTSTRMLTRDKFHFTYGKVEVRAKLPIGVGTWPAIWMLGSNIKTAGWPNCGEIDIMEHKGCELNKIYTTLHYPKHFGDKADGDSIVIKNVNTAFHKYATEWTQASIKFYVDDVLVKSYINDTASPFHKDFHIILNVAMGGNFAGAIDDNISKASMEVDYVRVYQ